MKFEYTKIYWGALLTEEEKETFETTSDRFSKKKIEKNLSYCCNNFKDFFESKDNDIDIGNDRREERDWIVLPMKYRDPYGDGYDSTSYHIYFCPFCGVKFEFECIGEFEEVRKNKQVTKTWTETETRISLKKLKSAMEKTDSIRSKNA